jgi:ankyrin repeat protein
MLLISEAVASTSDLFSLSNHDIVSRVISEGKVQRGPELVQCVDWVHSLAGDRHPNLDNIFGSTTFEINIPSELSSVSRAGDHSRLLFSIIHSAANNLLSESRASELLPVILQNSNRKIFHSLIAGQSPATKAIARTFLPGAMDSLDCSLVSALLDTGINPNSYVDLSPRRPLQIAIFKQSIEVTQLLLDRGADVNLSFMTYLFDDADSPLKVAIKTGRLDLVKLLLRAGARVNDPMSTMSRYAPSALQLASRIGQIDIVQLLLNAGADVHAPPQGPSGKTALQEAAGAGNMAVVQLLLSHGADVNAPKREYGGTALELAADSGNVEITQLLLFHGATDARFALDTASKSFSHRLVTHLIHSEMKLHPVADNAFGRTALRAATRCGDFELVRTLLECGVCANAPPPGGDISSGTVLQIAARQGGIKIAELLMSYGADINAPAIDRRDSRQGKGTATALQEAVDQGNMQLVSILLEHGADVNAPAANGRRTALAAAAYQGNSDIFQLLLDHGADLGVHGASVVIEAVGNVPLDFLQFLLDIWTDASGGSLDWTLNTEDMSALEIAVECNDVELIRLLLEHEAGDKSLALRDAVREGSSMEVVELLLVSGAVVGCLDDDIKEDMTALQEATLSWQPDVLRLLLEHRSHQTAAYEKSRALQMSALDGNFDAARLLLDHGADVNAAPSLLNYGDDCTRTALQAAAGKGGLEMVRFLLEAGADVESKVPSENEEGTALQFAAMAGSMSVVTLLIHNGADVFASAKGRRGRTAIEGAAEHGRLDMVKFLLDLGVEAAGSRAKRFARKEGHDGVVALLEEAGWQED